MNIRSILLSHNNLAGETSQRGIALLELVVVLPVLMVMLFAIIELGMIWYDSAILTNTSREAARTIVYAHKAAEAVSSMKTSAENVMKDVCNPLVVNFVAASCVLTVDDPLKTSKINGVDQYYVTVTISLTFTTLVLGKITPFPATKVLRSTTSMYFMN